MDLFEDNRELKLEELENKIKDELIKAKEKFSNVTSKDDVRETLKERRDEQLKKNLRWYCDYEDFVMEHIGNLVDWNNFEPILVEVESEEDKICYEYLRATVSSFPQNGYVGRQIKFLFKDKISNNIIGFSSIGSDLCIIGDRDKDIGWTHENKFKDRKISCGANINVCVALQPYGILTTGKLLAMIMCSNEIRDLWKEKYGDPCLYILTTSLFGKSSQYNRINDYLKYIGLTKGFGNTHVDKELYKMIDQYLTLKDKNIADEIKKKSNVKMTKIAKVESQIKGKLAVDKHQNLSALGGCIPEIKDAGQHYQKRGIYLGYLAENAREFLRKEISEDEIKWFDRPQKMIVDFWKERWFKMRLGKLKDELTFNPDQYRLENVLGEELTMSKQTTLF